MKIETASLGRQELHDLIGTAISPLPIAFISTVGPDGVNNAAPFSFVAPVCSKPAIICVAIGLRKNEKKDTLRNIESTLDFVVNVVDEKLMRPAIDASTEYPSDVDEIKQVGLTPVASDRVKSPRIAEAKVSLECKVVQEMQIVEQLREGLGLRAIVFGEVILAHVKDEVWVKGKIDPRRLQVIGRVAQNTYCRTGDMFEMKRA
ncbi:MAG: flavin reductase family protein [Chloroflexi bacterium]|nr:flavin reductase family protein [Chloroflexota bacterium]